jgi:hypothetical protein
MVHVAISLAPQLAFGLADGSAAGRAPMRPSIKMKLVITRAKPDYGSLPLKGGLEADSVQLACSEL